MVFSTRFPKHVHNTTTKKATPATTSVCHSVSPSGTVSASETAVVARPQPITKMISAMTTVGMSRSIQRVPVLRTTRAHTTNTRPAPTMAEPTPATPAVALAITTGPTKLKEGPR